MKDNLELYKLSKNLVLACYELTQDLPADEKTNFSRYIRGSALSFHTNIAKSIYLKKKKRKKIFKRARFNLIVIIAAIEILVEVGLVIEPEADVVKKLIDPIEKELG